MPLLDGMIAATALAHGLTVATRNRRDFKKAGVHFTPAASREIGRRVADENLAALSGKPPASQ